MLRIRICSFPPANNKILLVAVVISRGPFFFFRWFTFFEISLMCNHVFSLMAVHYLLSCAVLQSKTQSLESYDTQTTVLARVHGFHQANTLGLPI